jgi:flagellar FliJ protein
MKKFDFRLQRVMEVREAQKDQCARALADSQRELERHEHLLHQATAQYQESHDGLRHALKKCSRAGLLASLEKWRGRREGEVTEQRVATDQQHQVVDNRRETLIAVSKEKEALERLKDRAREQHRTDCQREEQAFLDELGCKIGRVWKYPRPDKRME